MDLDWNDQIKRELMKRNIWCKGVYGDEYTYEVGKDPYIQYKDDPNVMDKLKDDGFLYDIRTKHTNCVTQIKPQLSDDKRYYKNVFSTDQCNMVKGNWDIKAINRENKIGKGVCWTNAKDNYCGAKINPKYINSKNVGILKKQKQKCETSSKTRCEWVNNDCVSSNTETPVAEKPSIPNEMPKDMRNGMETFLEKWYNVENKKNFKDLFGPPPIINPIKPAPGEDNRCKFSAHPRDIINPKDKHPSIVQSIVNATMKNIAMYPDNTNRGILAWHSTGSGKTCTGMGVIDAFWDATTTYAKSNVVVPRQIIFASSIAGINANSAEVFARCARLFYDRFKDKEYEYGITKTDDKEDENIIIQNIVKALNDRNVMRLTFAELANRIEKTEEFKEKYKKENKKSYRYEGEPQKKGTWVDLDNSVLIIDEVQDIFQPIPTQRKQHDLVRRHLTNVKKHPNLKIVVLTATPGDTVDDVMTLINMVRHPDQDEIKAPKNMDDYEAASHELAPQIRGLVSFLDMSHDNTKFPTITGNNELEEFKLRNEDFVKYAEEYIKTIEAKNKTNMDWSELVKTNKTQDYWKKTRQLSNLYKIASSVDGSSGKIPKLIDRIVKKYKDEKHYVYSAFTDTNGLESIADELKNAGYVEFKHNMDNMVFDYNEKQGDKKKRFFSILSNKSLGSGGNGQETQKQIKQKADNLQKIINIYNDKNNLQGQRIHVILASDGYNQGVDLKGVKHIHILEPFLKIMSDKQAIGRAVRHCSHSDFPKDKWNVMIHRYAMGLESTSFTQQNKKSKKHYTLENIDKKIYEEAFERGMDLFTLYSVIQEAAIDCRVLQNFHKQNEDYSHLKCYSFKLTEEDNKINMKMKTKDADNEQKRIRDLEMKYNKINNSNLERQKDAIEKESMIYKKEIKKLKEKIENMKKHNEEEDARKKEEIKKLNIAKANEERRKHEEREREMQIKRKQYNDLKTSLAEIKKKESQLRRQIKDATLVIEGIKQVMQKRRLKDVGLLGKLQSDKFREAYQKMSKYNKELLELAKERQEKEAEMKKI